MICKSIRLYPRKSSTMQMRCVSRDTILSLSEHSIMTVRASRLSYINSSLINWFMWYHNYNGKSGCIFYGIHCKHDNIIKWKHFPHHWSFVWGIHRSLVDSPHKGQWRGALMFSLIVAWINGWANNREVGDLRCHRGHYDVIVMRRTYLIGRNMVQAIYGSPEKI